MDEPLPLPATKPLRNSFLEKEKKQKMLLMEVDEKKLQFPPQ
jgi:hypothetical protein